MIDPPEGSARLAVSVAIWPFSELSWPWSDVSCTLSLARCGELSGRLVMATFSFAELDSSVLTLDCSVESWLLIEVVVLLLL